MEIGTVKQQKLATLDDKGYIKRVPKYHNYQILAQKERNFVFKNDQLVLL